MSPLGIKTFGRNQLRVEVAALCSSVSVNLTNLLVSKDGSLRLSDSSAWLVIHASHIRHEGIPVGLPLRRLHLPYNVDWPD